MAEKNAVVACKFTGGKKSKSQINKMKTVKIILNVIASIWTPGAILVSKKQISGYVIFIIFILVEAIQVAFGLHNLFSILLFLFSRFSLCVVANFFYLKKLKIQNNRLLYLILIITAMTIQFIPYGFKAYKESNRLSNFSPEIIKKIQTLEEKAVTKTYENLPVFVTTFIAKIPTNCECKENINWMPGIYYLLNSSLESIIFYDSSCTEHYFQDFTGLKSELESIKLNPLSLQLFCAFSENTPDGLFDNAYLKLEQFGFKKITLIYLKDNRFVERYVFDSLQIIQIKQTNDNLLSQGIEPSSAMIKATMPLFNSCPTFWKIRMNISGKSYDEIKAKTINTLKTNLKMRNCNIRNAIDYCFLTYCPWNTYGIIEICINDFKQITKNTF